MPSHISPPARTAWRHVCKFLDDMGVLTTADGLAVEGLVESYAELCAARSALDARGSITYETTTKDGSTMYRPHPEVAMIADADRRFRGWLATCGLSPADRSKVSAAPDSEAANPFDIFLN